MLEPLIRRVATIDLVREFAELTRHLAALRPPARASLDGAILDRSQLRLDASVQLRVISELPEQLGLVAAHVRDERAPIGLRVGLRVILRSVICHARDVPAHESTAVSLLGPALLFHTLIRELGPWLPPALAIAEPERVLDVLALGIPADLRALADERLESGWARFHRLLQLGPSAVEARADIMGFDDAQLAALLSHPAASLPVPPRRPPGRRADGPEPDAPLPVFDPGSLALPRV